MPIVQANHIHLYYEEHGSGQPVVFIHGLGASTRDWGCQVPEFSTSYRVITFDLRGHGRSDKPAGPYDLQMLAADLAGLLDVLGIGSAHIVGHSLGGGVAFQLALDFPALVSILVIVNSGPTFGTSREQARQEIERRVGIVQQLGMQAMGEALSPHLFPKPEHATLRDGFVQRWAENDPQAYIEATRSMLGWDVADRIGSIQCPTLVLTADQDYLPVAAKEAYVALMPRAEIVVIADAHHAMPLEQPATFNRALAAFLARH